MAECSGERICYGCGKPVSCVSDKDRWDRDLRIPARGGGASQLFCNECRVLMKPLHEQFVRVESKFAQAIMVLRDLWREQLASIPWRGVVEEPPTEPTVPA